MNVFDKIIKITRQLYPTGRAFKMPFDGYFESLSFGLAQSEMRAYNDSVSILDSLLPDSDRFTADDATDWERRLGIYTNTSVSLASRKLAILRKMAAPGSNPAKGNYKYIEQQLQAAGFDVYVYENRFFNYPSGYVTQNPADLYAGILSVAYHGDFQHGDVQSGYYINNIVANSIYNEVDICFNTGPDLKSTFFIGGSTLGSLANVPASRKLEFRQLILQLKQVQDKAILFIQYT